MFCLLFCKLPFFVLDNVSALNILCEISMKTRADWCEVSFCEIWTEVSVWRTIRTQINCDPGDKTELTVLNASPTAGLRMVNGAWRSEGDQPKTDCQIIYTTSCIISVFCLNHPGVSQCSELLFDWFLRISFALIWNMIFVVSMYLYMPPVKWPEYLCYQQTHLSDLVE